MRLFKFKNRTLADRILVHVMKNIDQGLLHRAFSLFLFDLSLISSTCLHYRQTWQLRLLCLHRR